MAKATQPEKRLEERLHNLVSDVKYHYPQAPLGKDWENAFAKDLVKAEREFGIARLEVAVERTIMESTFTPNIADIRKRVPPAGLMATYNEHCPDCSGCGWRRVRPEDVFSPVTRCHCRKIAEAAQ